MPVFILSRRQRVTEQRAVALDLLETLTGRAGGFLEVSQMLTGRVPIRGLVLDTYLTGLVPGVALSVSGEVLDLVMTAGGMDVESFQYSAERGQGARLDVTVIGDARGARVPVVTAKAGKYAAAFYVPGTLPEWEAERNAQGWTTTLHASDRALVPQAKLPELVPWETQESKDARRAQEKALRVAKVPPAQREAALRDGRRMAVDNVVLAALATVPHRLLVAPPFPGYDFRADSDGPTYSTAGRTAQQVVQDLWGMLGITAGWEGGVLTIRGPGPTGDLVLPAPIESERYERITLDAPTIELQGGTPADDDEGEEDPSGGDDSDQTPDPEDPDDPDDPDKPDNSPDPDERDGDGTRGFAEGISPTPEVGEVAARAVPFTWEAVPTAIQYILERVEGRADQWTLWERVTITNATRYTDDTVRPLTTYTYRLRVNATAYENDEKQNVIWQPSEWVQVTTPPADVDAPPHPPTNLEGYWRSSTGFGIKWQAPKADPEDADPPRRGPADYYRIEAWSTVPNTPMLASRVTTQTWGVVEGLPTGAALRVKVYAANSLGDSEPALADVQLVNLPPGPTGAPDLKADEKERLLTATWERASGATSYEAQYAPAPVGTPEINIAWRVLLSQEVNVPKDGEGGKPSLTLSGLEYATRYAFRVRGNNELGAGAWSPVVYEVTASEPPQPEPDPELDDFEKARTRTITTKRTTEDTEEETTVWKIGGRVTHMNRRTWQKLAVVPLDWDGKTSPPRRWYLTSITNARYFYEIPGWPLTLTGSVTETMLHAVQPTQRGDRGISGVLPEIGQEQEKIHQEWSPQGWLNRRTTWRSRPVFVEGEADEKGEVVSRKMGNQEEMIVEIWYPVGDGLWYYQRTGTITTLAPVFVRKEGEKEGDWEGMETTVKALPGESSVSEDAPPMAVLPKEKDKKDGKQEPPPLTRNPTSPALNDYPLDRKWFSTLDAGNGDGKGGTGNDTPSTPGGSSNPNGVPEPDPPPKSKTAEPVRVVKPAIPPGGPTPSSSGNGAVLSATIPWVRTAAGLARYAAYMAQQGGPRIRITRTYILPTTPPSLDAVESISVSGSAGQFSMTVVTETR